MAHGVGPTSNGNLVSAGRWWRVRSTNTPYVPPRMCGGRVLLSGTRGGADVKRETGHCRALVACPLNQHTLRPAADVWGAGITEWHTGRGQRQMGTGCLPGAGGMSAQPTHPTFRCGCVWGAGITPWHTGRGRHQTGTGSLPGGGGMSAQPTRPTSRRRCVGGGYYSVAHGAGPTSNGNWVSAGRCGVFAQPTCPTSRRGCVGDGYY